MVILLEGECKLWDGLVVFIEGDVCICGSLMLGYVMLWMLFLSCYRMLVFVWKGVVV